MGTVSDLAMEFIVAGGVGGLVLHQAMALLVRFNPSLLSALRTSYGVLGGALVVSLFFTFALSLFLPLIDWGVEQAEAIAFYIFYFLLGPATYRVTLDVPAGVKFSFLQALAVHVAVTVVLTLLVLLIYFVQQPV